MDRMLEDVTARALHQNGFDAVASQFSATGAATEPSVSRLLEVVEFRRREVGWAYVEGGAIRSLTAGSWAAYAVVLPAGDPATARQTRVLTTRVEGGLPILRIKPVAITEVWAGLGQVHEAHHLFDFAIGVEAPNPSADDWIRGEVRAFLGELTMVGQLRGADSLSLTPPQPGTIPQGPQRHLVSNQEVATGLFAAAGSTVTIQASGTVDLGGAFLGIGAPKLTADGDSTLAPPDYPAPGLRKNSLIVKVGSIWYQGGTNESFSPTEDGELILRPNDRDLGDNSRGWQVTITVSP